MSQCFLPEMFEQNTNQMTFGCMKILDIIFGFCGFVNSYEGGAIFQCVKVIQKPSDPKNVSTTKCLIHYEDLYQSRNIQF